MMPSNINLFSAGALLLTLAGCFGFGSATRSWQEARKDVVEALADSGDKTMLFRPTPPLAAAKAYPIGSVFLAEQLNIRFTGKCVAPVQPKSVDLGPLPSVSTGKKFDLDIAMPTALQNAINEITGFNTAVAYKKTAVFAYEAPLKVMQLDTAEVNKLLTRPECLMEIANRPVLVLTAIYEMKETYKSEGAVSANAKLDILKDNVFKVAFDNNGNFNVQDKEPYPRVWALAARQVDVPGFVATASDAAKRQKVIDFLAQEGEGVARPGAIRDVRATIPVRVIDQLK